MSEITAFCVGSSGSSLSVGHEGTYHLSPQGHESVDGLIALKTTAVGPFETLGSNYPTVGRNQPKYLLLQNEISFASNKTFKRRVIPTG
jgi:hypothetical protein